MARKTPRRGRRRQGAAPGPVARPKRRALPPQPEGLSDDIAQRAGVALTGVLGLLLALRVVLLFVPNMWSWGINVQRFVDPMAGWAGWALMAIALIPAVGSRTVPAVAGLGDLLLRGGWVLPVGVGSFAAALVYVLPDQVRFVGDFLLRQGTVEQGARPGLLFPQALPLDVFLHYTLPVAMGDAGLGDANAAARVIGAVEAGLLAVAAVLFVRVLVFTGVAATAAFAIVLFGGYLGMFTGYSKAFADLVVIVAAAGVFGLMSLRTGRGLFALGITLAVALTLHRSALGLLPAVLFVWILWLRDRAGEQGLAAVLRKPLTIAAAVVPIAGLAFMLPRIIATVLQWDSVHFNPAEVQAQGGALQAAFAGTRTMDMVNLVLVLSPLALGIPVLAIVMGRSMPRGRELVLLLLLLIPLMSFWPFIHPVHGMFRDWDDFAFTGVALSLVAAWLVGETLRRTGKSGHAWLGAAVVMAAVVPSVQWIAHHADLDRGLSRVQAFMTEPPERTFTERGYTWDYLGIRNYRLERYDAAAEAFEQAAATAPSPRVLQEWAAAETQRGNFKGAQRVYWQLLHRNPDNAVGWFALSAVSSRMGDMHESIYAASKLLELQPGNADATDALAYWRRLPAAMRDSLDRLYPARDSTDRRW